MRLEGKVAVITGGAKGLGKAMACTFAKEGARVIACDLTPLSYDYEGVEGYKLDVTNREGCEALAEYIEATYGGLDILVNNAGITKDALLGKMSHEMWDQVINVNLTGLYNITKPLSKCMLEKGYGSIINIASVVGEYGNIGQSNYAATKSAIFGLTKTWAKEFARKGANIRVNAIAPGYIMTDILKTVPEHLLEKFAKMTMLGRLGEPQEVANSALFLASDEASYVTGHTLSVNGGMRL